MEKVNCIICGKNIIYHDSPEEHVCMVCGKSFMSEAVCEAGHFVCDECHGADAIKLITTYCAASNLRDPIAIATELMKFPQIHMHGPEHHVLVGLALLTAAKNCGADIPETAFERIVHHGKQVPGGSCGFCGNCGAAVSCGIFISAITGASPLSEGEKWALPGKMTARALEDIAAYGGPRCCKRDAYTAMYSTAKFLEDNFGIKLDMPEKTVCEFMQHNAECIVDKCPYFG